LSEFRWYKHVNKSEPITQGDFINKCPVAVPVNVFFDDPEKDKVDLVKYNVIIMSQACDLSNEKIDMVLVCPVWPLTAFGEQSDFFKSTNGKNSLRKGEVSGYHLLNVCDIAGFENEYLVVDLRNVYGVDFKFLTDFAQDQDRLRLLPPYREHLSQAFARFFMRVGLPLDIPKFISDKDKKKSV